MKKKPISPIRYYYVDEGGDSTLFASRGRVIVGTPGCSRFFILGLLDIADPPALEASLMELRQRLLADPYFKNVPSMQPEGQKTYLTFHAKDDLPEVRREVFSLLRNTAGLRFFAVVRDKLRVLEYVHQRNQLESSFHYQPNELYDYLVRRLFRDRLHKAASYQIIFARRGSSDRTQALDAALQTARHRFAEKWGITSEAPLQVFAGIPRYEAGLQVVDYFVWSLQRLYEAGEGRYLEYLWPSFRLVQDIDDTRVAAYGAYYYDKNPLNAAALAWRNKNARDIGPS